MIDMDISTSMLELFSGVGGLSYGFELAGYDVIAGVDVNEDAVDAFEENHDSRGIVCDLATMPPQEFEEKYDIHPADVEIVGGGPPCQPFSTASVNMGDDERNNLVFRFADYIDHYQPSLFVMENVRGIVNDDVFTPLCEKLEEMGYSLTYDVLDASEYGVPQKRKRLILIGAKSTFEPQLPAPTHTDEKCTVKEAIGDLPALAAREKSNINGHIAPNHRSQTVERIKRVPYGGDMGDLDEEYQLASYDPVIHGECYGRLVWDEPSMTITTGFTRNGSGRFTHPEQHRALTPREAARLQTFPDQFVFPDDIYTAADLIGNAVPPLLAYHVALAVKRHRPKVDGMARLTQSAQTQTP